MEPREPGNVGAAARAMKNFGFLEMTIVGEVPELQPVAQWWASGAGEVVAQARRVPTLAAALAEAHLTIATTSSRSRSVQVPLTPDDVREALGALAEGQTLALVFGREDRGLTAEEITLCHRTAVIPTSDLHPTLNLAQAVAIFAWTLSRESPAGEARALAPVVSLERLHDTARRLLLDVGFLTQENAEQIYADLRAIAGRALLDERELAILLGIARQIRWAIESKR